MVFASCGSSIMPLFPFLCSIFQKLTIWNQADLKPTYSSAIGSEIKLNCVFTMVPEVSSLFYCLVLCLSINNCRKSMIVLMTVMIVILLPIRQGKTPWAWFTFNSWETILTWHTSLHIMNLLIAFSILGWVELRVGDHFITNNSSLLCGWNIS